MNMVSLGSRSFQGRPVAAGRSGTIAALDVGSSKISCFIAKIEPGRMSNGHAPVRVIGIGHQVSRGIRAGACPPGRPAREERRAGYVAPHSQAGPQSRGGPRAPASRLKMPGPPKGSDPADVF